MLSKNCEMERKDLTHLRKKNIETSQNEVEEILSRLTQSRAIENRGKHGEISYFILQGKKDDPNKFVPISEFKIMRAQFEELKNSVEAILGEQKDY